MGTQSNPAIVGLAIDRGGGISDPDSAYQPERVRRLVRKALLESGLGMQTPEVPLADVIRRGSTVLVKPNWVTHANQGDGGQACLYTHHEFVLASLREVLAAGPARVVLGDAPIQMCEWPRLVTENFCRCIAKEAAAFGVPVEIVDFRRTIMKRGSLYGALQTELRPEERFIYFDLGSESLLEPISEPGARFRVADYDPDKLACNHRRGTHKYLLCKEAFEADFVLSLPKLKTHAKAGLTGALKNLVGINGNKDYLPHHRAGGSARGGDCYPGRSMRKELAQALEDAANRRLGLATYPAWRALSRAGRLLSGGFRGRMDGAWYGNDTVWRMVLDLNRVLLCGRPDGTLAGYPLRKILSLTDAIIAGQGDGPLRPDPLPLGVVTCSASAPAADAVHAALMRFDRDRIPMLREAFSGLQHALATDTTTVICRAERTDMDLAGVAARYGVAALPACGWMGKIELEQGSAAKTRHPGALSVEA